MASRIESAQFKPFTLEESGIPVLDRSVSNLARAQVALDAGRMGSWSHHVPEDQVWGDQIVADLLQLDIAHLPWSSADFFNALHPDDVVRISAIIAEAYSGKVPFYDVEVRRKPVHPDEPEDQAFWIGGRAQVTERDTDGNPLRVIGVNWDITEAKKVERRLSMLAAEMDHRVKNAFAVIRALINIGSETAEDKEALANTLRTQVEALATAHTLSARIARSQNDAAAPVTLAEVFETALDPWRHAGATTNTEVILDCSPSIVLPPVQVAAFAMLLYELSTNATKHGPLGEMGGSLHVQVIQDIDEHITLIWDETLPKHLQTRKISNPVSGFGAVLLNHCANNLNATLTREMRPKGLLLKMVMAPPRR